MFRDRAEVEGTINQQLYHHTLDNATGYQMAEFSGQKSNLQNTPMHSQYNNLINKREGGNINSMGQTKWIGASNGFKSNQGLQ